MDVQWEHGNSPLHVAAWNGGVDQVRALIERGSVLEARNDWGWTPLHSAANQGQADVVAALIEYGADIDARTRSGETASDLAWGDAVTEATLERGAATAP